MRCWSRPVPAGPSWPRHDENDAGHLGRWTVNPVPASWNDRPWIAALLRRRAMKNFGKTAALALFISFGVAGSALAQSESGGAMSNGSMSNGSSDSMSHGAMSGSMTGSMDHDKMKNKKKTKAAMTNGAMTG